MSETRTYDERLELARELDRSDELAGFREQFHIPRQENGDPVLYLTGHSLGLQPKRTGSYVQEVLDQWQHLGVRGHFEGDYPWAPYHEFLAEPMANLIGALPGEVVMMNSLTVNLHLMLATFYKPTSRRHKILIEEGAFPSDYQAVISQIAWHGFSPEESLIRIKPPQGGNVADYESLGRLIEEQGHEIAVIMLPGVQYYTGQVLWMNYITTLAHQRDIVVGFDLAHAAGNIQMSVHDWDIDFAVWCSYKYLNSGPGSVGGCYVHERHARNVDLPRLAGWWGHDKATRFLMKNEFSPIPTAEGWQLSNPPILSLAAIRASLDVFTEAGGMEPLCHKSGLLTSYLEAQLISQLGDRVNIITPLVDRGCQLSLEIDCGDIPGQQVHDRLLESGVETDWREPNVIRAAPAPLYNTFEDCFYFVEKLKEAMEV
ncbi:MAG: kynureninase [Pirellulaceae bacterium]